MSVTLLIEISTNGNTTKVLLKENGSPILTQNASRLPRKANRMENTDTKPLKAFVTKVSSIFSVKRDISLTSFNSVLLESTIKMCQPWPPLL